jgi:hypothetical protein
VLVWYDSDNTPLNPTNNKLLSHNLRLFGG